MAYQATYFKKKCLYTSLASIVVSLAMLVVGIFSYFQKNEPGYSASVAGALVFLCIFLEIFFVYFYYHPVYILEKDGLTRCITKEKTIWTEIVQIESYFGILTLILLKDRGLCVLGWPIRNYKQAIYYILLHVNRNKVLVDRATEVLVENIKKE